MKILKSISIVHVIALVVLFATVSAHAGIPQLVTSKERDWNFIQSVGGMDISVEGANLTVDCDVSGLKTVTVKPTLINSGIGVRKLKHKRDGSTILLTLKTCVIGKGVSTSPAPVDLSAHPDGAYEVKYLDPDGARHSIGKIAVKKGSTEQPNPLASWRADNPNIRVTLRAADGANNINIQRGRTSFLNYAVGTPDHRVVATNVTEETYIALRDACFAILRNLPESVDGGTPVFINVPLSEEEIEAHGLSTNSLTFTYRHGQSRDADILYKLTTELLGIPLSLGNLVYVYSETAATQHPLVCGEGQDFPDGHEMLFLNKETGVTIHAVFPADVKPPRDLDGVFTLHGEFQTIKKWDAYGAKKPPASYTYLVVTSYEKGK